MHAPLRVMEALGMGTGRLTGSPGLSRKAVRKQNRPRGPCSLFLGRTSSPPASVAKSPWHLLPADAHGPCGAGRSGRSLHWTRPSSSAGQVLGL